MRFRSLFTALTLAAVPVASQGAEDPTAELVKEVQSLKVGAKDWPQFGGWSHRNNTPDGKNIPDKWDTDSGENILWTAELGSQSYGNPVVANGKVYVGTNNYHAYLSRFPKSIDLGVLLCFDEKTGKFLWQSSSTKLPSGLVHDWPDMGICCSPACEGDRLYFVTSRGEVQCLDSEGFIDGENDGPFKSEDNENKNEADILWKFDMMGKLGVSQHNMCSCSILIAGDLLLINTSNGVDESHTNIPAPDAPSFFAMKKATGEVVWTDKSPGRNVLHGQWSSPTHGVIGGQAQAIFGGGDGWLYSFDPAGDGAGKSKLLWKFDCNPKSSKYSVSGKSERNHLIATPVIYDGHVYVGVGEDPEHGEGNGHFWCIDPTKRGDVSPELAMGSNDKPITDPGDGTRRLQAIDTNAGEKAVANPNSAAVWHYIGEDLSGDKKLDFEEEMHRTMGSCAIKDDLLFVADLSGVFHCLDAKTGKSYWNYDMFAASWGSALIVDGKVYAGDEDGEVAVFKLSKEMELINENKCGNSVYSTPIVANDVLYIMNKSKLFAIKAKE
jgi:outer membrane protein assembly factor BamB